MTAGIQWGYFIREESWFSYCCHNLVNNVQIMYLLSYQTNSYYYTTSCINHEIFNSIKFIFNKNILVEDEDVIK